MIRYDEVLVENVDRVVVFVRVLSLRLFPLICRGDAGQLSLRCRATFVIFPLLPVVGLFSPLFFRADIDALRLLNHERWRQL